LILNWFPGDASKAQPKELFEWRAGALPAKYRAMIDELRMFADNEAAFDIEWPSHADRRFVVWEPKRGVQCFIVTAEGAISVPFSKWPDLPPPLVDAVITRLNAALATDWFTGRQRKKKGFDLYYLLRSGPGVQGFLDVWRWFAQR
jgi:hypothetical protein